MSGRTPFLGVATFQVWEIWIPQHNPAGLTEGTYRYAIGGYKAACDNYVMTTERIGLVIKVNGENPDTSVEPMPRAEDLGWHAYGEMAGCQPSIAYWPVMHFHFQRGTAVPIHAMMGQSQSIEM